ncbi:hypothetical protein N0V92_011236 [Colletotrichum tropicale]|nr:hypothetical protein N0V92_011236 [Colletotrichum tropicale]
MNIPQLPTLVGLPNASQALKDGDQLCSHFNKTAGEIRQGIRDDASALGFDPDEPFELDGNVDLTGHKTVAELRAAKAQLLESEKMHEQLMKAHKTAWQEVVECEHLTQKRSQLQLPPMATKNIIQMGTSLIRDIVRTGLLETSNDPNGQDGDDLLIRLLHGSSNQQAITSQEQAQRIKLLEEQKNDWERKASELEANVNTFKTELEEKQREIDRLTGIIPTTVQSGNTIVRSFVDLTSEDGNSGDEYEPEMNSTRSYREHHERNDIMMRARICLQESDINSKDAKIKMLQDELDAERTNSAFYVTLVETKSMEINRLNDEKDAAIATLESEIETLKIEYQKAKEEAQTNLEDQAEASKRSHETDISEARSEIRRLKAESNSLQTRISTLNAKQLTANETAQTLQDLKRSKAATEISLQREKNERMRTMAEANRSRDQLLSNLTAFVFDSDDGLMSGLKTALAKDNQPARRVFQPWSIESTWTKAGPYYDCDARSAGELFVRLVSVVRAGALATDEFLVLMKKFTSFMATTSEANVAVIEWLLSACNDILSATQAMADIPAKTAVWALADVLASRWPNMERHAYDVPMFAEVLQSVHAPDGDPCWDWILPMQDDSRQRFLAKQEDWPVGVLIDPTNRRCTFIERELVTEVDPAQLYSGEVIRIRGPDEQFFGFDLRSAETMQWWLNW